MTSFESALVPTRRSEDPTVGSMPLLWVELLLYAAGCFLAASLALWTGFALFVTSSESLLEHPFEGAEGLVLGVLVLALGLRISYVLALASREHWRVRRHVPHDPAVWPRVSVLVPAYNEADSIAAAIESTLAVDYPDFEILIVDDGSSDDTFDVARRFEGRHGGGAGAIDVRVFRKPNAGKWSAHNFALRQATGDYVLCVDADSRLDRESLRHLVRAMSTDPRIGAVAGQVKVRNRDRLLTCVQALEYLTCNGSMRTAQSGDGCVLVVPGPIGLFRREVFDQVWHEFGRRASSPATGHYDGPFEDDTFAEDFDLSLAVLQLGHRIVYEPRAISNTTAPNTMRSLLNQRYRWQRGSLQVLRKLLRRSRSRPDLLHPVLLRWLVLAYAVDLVLIPIWLLIGLPYLLSLYLAGTAIASTLVGFVFLMFGANFFLSLCYASTHRDSKWLAPLCVVHDVYNTCFLQALLAFVVIDEVRGAPMRWS